MIDPNTKAIRYIGRSNRLGDRFKEHIRAAKSKATEKLYVHQWIAGLLKANQFPEIMKLAFCAPSYAEDVERFMILYHKSRGCDLTNLTDGGDGLSRVTDETRRRMSEGVKKRPPMPLVQRLEISKLFRGRVSPTKGMEFSEETRAKMRASHARRKELGLQVGRPLPIIVTEATRRKLSELASRDWVRRKMELSKEV